MNQEDNFSLKKERELEEDIFVLEKAIKSFWEILPVPVCTTNPLFSILSTSRAFDNFFGYSENEIMGEDLTKIIGAKDDFAEVLKNLASQKKVSGVESVLRNRQNKELFVLISAIAQEDEHGEVFSYLFSFVDITLLKKTEQELQTKIQESLKKTAELNDSRRALMNILEDVEEERQRAEHEKNRTMALIKNFADGLITMERGKITLFNPKAEEFFNISANEVINKSLVFLSKEHSAFSALFQLLQNKKTKQIFRETLAINTNLTVEVSLVCVRNTQKACVAQMIILHDVTREKMVEKLKTEFVSISAHQLRTPLSVIKWILRTVLDGDAGELAEAQKELIEKAYNNNERMIRLVNDLLNVTRIEEGRFIAQKEPLDVCALIRESIETIKDSVANKGLTLKTFIPPTMILVQGDKEKLMLVIQNLLENALHYTKEGFIAIRCDLIENKTQVKIAVQDSGIGIPQNQQERIFSRFFRAENATKIETEGSGLGLFIAKNVVEAHGGKIWFESQEGKGTTFYFTLPTTSKK